MDLIIHWIKEYCSCVGIDIIEVYPSDNYYLLIVLNGHYIGTDVIEVIYKGIENVFKKSGIITEED